MSAPYTMQALQELADDGVHLLEIDDAGLVATVQELDALRARVAELERLTESAQDQTEEAQGIARDAMKRFDEMQALLQEYKADAARLRHERARVAELERERDEARERVLVMSDAWKAAMDNVARLRFALEWCEANWTTPAVDRGAGLPMVRAALASTPRAEPTPRAKAEAFFAGFAGDDDAGVLAWSEPSAEPTPRDMRVAEAVAREYERKLDLTGAGGLDIDLAAVVAKAVGT